MSLLPVPGGSVGKTQTAKVMQIVGGWNYLEASSFTCLCLGWDDWEAGLSGAVDWSTYIWPVHVAWAAHRAVAGFQEGEGESIWRVSVPGNRAKAAWSFRVAASEVTWRYFCHTLIG